VPERWNGGGELLAQARAAVGEAPMVSPWYSGRRRNENENGNEQTP
jgi:hypothetical protein